jgi:hypothetical protein
MGNSHQRHRLHMAKFAWRDESIWLSPVTVDRVAGLPVVMEHPPIGTLNSHEFTMRAVGSCLFGFVRDKELWGIARVLDRQANQLMLEGLDTSPGVQFAPGEGARTTFDGKPLLVEGDPCLLDHIAICEKGRWTRDGPPGVQNSGDDDQQNSPNDQSPLETLSRLFQS